MNAKPRIGHAPGFTLIELVLVIIIISVAAVPILGMFGQVASSLGTNEELQTGTQLAQEKAEELLALRRINGYSDANLALGGPTTETLTGSFTGYSRITTISVHPGGSGGCPATASCKQIQIQIQKGGDTLSTLYTMLADY